MGPAAHGTGGGAGGAGGGAGGRGLRGMGVGVTWGQRWLHTPTPWMAELAATPLLTLLD